MPPYLSIIIPVRDSWSQLLHCLDSLARQHDPPALEIIIIDDGSQLPAPVQTAETLQRMGVRLQRQIGLGISAARNAGTRLATGNLLLFVDSDCVLHPECLTKLLQAANRHLADMAFQLSISSPQRTLVQKIEGYRLASVRAALMAKSGHVLYANTSGFALRSSYLRPLQDLFDVSVARGEDTLLLAELIRQGKPPRFLPQCSVLHCPEMSFPRYFLKQFRVGYEGSYPLSQLRAAGGVLLGRRSKLQALGRLFSSNSSRPEFFTVAAAFFCLLFEKVGRASSRSIGIPHSSSKRKVLSLHLDVMRESELLFRILNHAQDRCGLIISYANAWTLVQAQKPGHLRSLLNSFDICLLDGVGAMLASLLLNFKRSYRITANNYLFPLCRELAARNLTIALIGAEASVMKKAVAIISAEIPHLNIVVHHSGYLTPSTRDSLIAELLRQKPNLVLIGQGQPLQEELAMKLRPLLPQTSFLCVGGLFDYLTGPREWADLARRFGLEWLFRLLYTPRKTAHRYIVGVPALLVYIIAENFRKGLSSFDLELWNWRVRSKAGSGQDASP